MQAIHRKVNPSANYSFVARIDKLPYLYEKWHFHPELELTHIVQSRGTRFVGDSIEEFEEGLVGVACPVYNRTGEAAAAVNIYGPAFRFPRHGDYEAVTRLLMEVCGRMTAVLQNGAL